jgi:hypothetical protein
METSSERLRRFNRLLRTASAQPFKAQLSGIRRTGGTLVVGLSMATLSYWPMAWGASFEVHWTAGELSVAAEHAPLADVVTEVTRQAKMELQGKENLKGEISTQFSNLSLEEGLKLLLGDRSYGISELTDAAGMPPQRTLLIGSAARRAAQATSATPAPKQPTKEQRLMPGEDAGVSVTVEDWYLPENDTSGQ